MENKGLTLWMVLSYAVPVLGGLAAYFSLKENNPELSRLLMAGSFAVPVTLSGSLILSLPGALLSALLAAIILNKTYLKDNYFSGMVYAFYLSLLGALYAYYGPMKGKQGREAIGWYALISIFINPALIIQFAAAILIPYSL